MFDAPMVNIGATVLMTGPDGQQYPTGTPVVDSSDVRTDVPALGPAGQYTVTYRVVSGDGHPVEGQIRFQLDLPVPATSAPADVDRQPVPPPVASSTPPTPAESAGSSPNLPPTTDSSAAGAVTTGTSPTTAVVSPSAINEPQGGISGWWWAAAMVLLILVAAGGAVIIRQRHPRRQN